MDLLNEWISSINDVLWSYILVTLLLGCAFWFTIRSRFVQFRMMGEMVRLLGDSPKKAGSHEKHISSFQAFAVSLASRVGTGNLAGVATAITVGGPGAVFWMWLIALLGSSSAFVESTLAQLYKRKGKDSFVGGPAYYMEKGLKARWMGILFAILISITFGFAFNSVQSNTICAAWEKAFGIDHVWMGIVLTAVTLLIIFGGIHRIARVSGVIVPVMALGYIVLALGVVLFNLGKLPECDPPDRIECLRLGTGLGRRYRGNADAGHQTGFVQQRSRYGFGAERGGHGSCHASGETGTDPGAGRIYRYADHLYLHGFHHPVQWRLYPDQPERNPADSGSPDSRSRIGGRYLYRTGHPAFCLQQHHRELLLRRSQHPLHHPPQTGSRRIPAIGIGHGIVRLAHEP